jgi:hypothetical protein
MKRSALVDGLLLAAIVLSTLSLFALLREIPDECAARTPGSVEDLFAPCLASSREDFDRPAVGSVPDPRLNPLPPTVPITADRARTEPRSTLDPETTGSTSGGQAQP